MIGTAAAAEDPQVAKLRSQGKIFSAESAGSPMSNSVAGVVTPISRAVIRCGMALISFARHQYPPAVIQHAVRLYLRFTLSYRDVEDLLAERELDVF